MMEELRAGTVYALLGPVPPLETLKLLRHAFCETFRQVVCLASHTAAIVQLCNFVRRCRKEKQGGKQFKYLVFLQYLPHREVHHLLHVASDLNMTIIAYGGVCVDRAIGSLCSVRNRPCAVLEWSQQFTWRRPIVWGVWLSEHRPFIVNTLRGVDTPCSDTTAMETDLGQSFQQWTATQNPHTWKLEDFPVATQSSTYQTRHQAYDTFPSSQSSQSSSRPAPATTTMNIRMACRILQIGEHETTSADLIRKAYRKRAIALHPDKHTNATDEVKRSTTSAFAELNEAKRYLDSLLAT